MSSGYKYVGSTPDHAKAVNAFRYLLEQMLSRTNCDIMAVEAKQKYPALEGIDKLLPLLL
jgi:hypothetical protein